MIKITPIDLDKYKNYNFGFYGGIEEIIRIDDLKDFKLPSGIFIYSIMVNYHFLDQRSDYDYRYLIKSEEDNLYSSYIHTLLGFLPDSYFSWYIDFDIVCQELVYKKELKSDRIHIQKVNNYTYKNSK